MLASFVNKHIFPCFFLFSALDSILGFFGFGILTKFSMIYLACTLVWVSSRLSKFDIYDHLILFGLFSIAIISAFHDIDPRLYYAGLRYQLALTSFFFVGKYYTNVDLIFKKGQYVFITMAVVAFILYVLAPDWYISRKAALVDYMPSGFTDSLEFMRLSGFSSYPYWISYGAFIYITYFLDNLSNNKYGLCSRKYICFLLLFLLIVLFLCLQRVAIVSAIAVFLYYCFFKNSIANKSQKLLIIIALLCLCSIFYYCLIKFFDENFMNFIMSKFEEMDTEEGFLENRVEIFTHKREITFWGDGIGLYSHTALHLGKESITDQQYLRIIYETGIWGFSLYILFFCYVIKKGLKKIKQNLFCLLIVLFYLFSMMGANSLSMEAQHTAIFWICCGMICRKKRIV